MKASNQEWKQAIDICKDLQDLSDSEIQQRLQELDLTPSVSERVLKLLSGMKQEHNLQPNAAKLFGKVQHLKSDPSIIGKTLGDYKITDLIAKGGMSSIFKAYNTRAKINKPVALKILSPYMFSDKAVELFKREQLILSQLQHSNIVSFHHSGKTEDGTQYLIMEYVETAQTITEFCQKQQLNNKQIVRYVIQLAHILAYAHSNLIIHRDIKPANVLIDQHGTIKVIDFGIAQIASNNESTSTQVFTKDSASPEQLLGLNVNTQTDIFSLGAILLELLVRKKPLPDINLATYKPENDTKHVNKLLKDSALEKDLQNIIRKAMHVDLSQRYATMEAFAKDLDNWLLKRPVSASADSRIYKIKKFVLRNPISVALSSMVLASLLVGLGVINNYANTAKDEAEKANATLQLITQIFSQTDSYNPPDPNLTLKQTLDHFSQEKLPHLQLDREVLARVHATLGEIYGNFAMFKASQNHYQLALDQYTPSQRKSQLDALKIQIGLGTMMGYLGAGKPASEILQQVYDSLQKFHPKDHDMQLYALTNLMDSYYDYNYYGTEDAQRTESQILNLIASEPEINPLLVANAYSALSVKLQHQPENNLDQAELYLSKGIQGIDTPEFHTAYEFANLNQALAVLKYRQQKYEESEVIFAGLINKMQESQPNNPALIRLYDSHASVLLQLGQSQEAMTVLSKAVQLAETTHSEESLFVPLSKKAMYHIRLNDFKSGLLDQLKLVAVTQTNKPSHMQGTLFNLSLILFSIGHSEIAQNLVDASVTYLDPNNPGLSAFLEHSYLNAGLAHFYIGETEAAKNNLLTSNEYNTGKYASTRMLLEHLLNPTPHQIFDAPERKSLTQNLLFLLNPVATLNPDHLDEFCQITDGFIKSKNIGVKMHFLNRCQQLYPLFDLQVPKIITSEALAIQQAIETAKSVPVDQIFQHLEIIFKKN